MVWVIRVSVAAWAKPEMYVAPMSDMSPVTQPYAACFTPADLDLVMCVCMNIQQFKGNRGVNYHVQSRS